MEDFENIDEKARRVLSNLNTRMPLLEKGATSLRENLDSLNRVLKACEKVRARFLPTDPESSLLDDLIKKYRKYVEAEEAHARLMFVKNHIPMEAEELPNLINEELEEEEILGIEMTEYGYRPDTTEEEIENAKSFVDETTKDMLTSKKNLENKYPLIITEIESVINSSPSYRSQN